MYEADIDLFIDNFIDGFFNQLRGNLQSYYKSRYKGIDSPLEELYDWVTDDYSSINTFRAEKQISDLSNESEVVGLADIIEAVRNALCNKQGYDSFESYSEKLHIALFKYKAKNLKVLKTRRNYVDLHFRLNCFNWLDVADRYFVADAYIEVPLRYLFNKDVLKKLILKDLYSSLSYNALVIENMFDIDSIEYCGISQFNIATYGVDKNSLSNAVRSIGVDDLKPIISYRTDSELISYISNNAEYITLPVEIDNILVLDFIRIYYILMVNNFDYTASQFLRYFSKDYSYDLSSIVDHLNNFKAFERTSFQSTYNNNRYGIGMLYSYNKDNLLLYLNKLVNYGYLGQDSVNTFSDFLVAIMHGLLI